MNIIVSFNVVLDQFIVLSVGVEVYQDCTLARWNDGAEKAQLKCATFTTSAKPVRVDCQVNKICLFIQFIRIYWN